MNEENIKKGDKNYFEFVEKIGLDCTEIMTPCTPILNEMGNYEITDLGFIKLAIMELCENFNE